MIVLMFMFIFMCVFMFVCRHLVCMVLLHLYCIRWTMYLCMVLYTHDRSTEGPAGEKTLKADYGCKISLCGLSNVYTCVREHTHNPKRPPRRTGSKSVDSAPRNKSERSYIMALLQAIRFDSIVVQNKTIQFDLMLLPTLPLWAAKRFLLVWLEMMQAVPQTTKNVPGKASSIIL